MFHQPTGTRPGFRWHRKTSSTRHRAVRRVRRGVFFPSPPVSGLAEDGGTQADLRFFRKCLLPSRHRYFAAVEIHAGVRCRPRLIGSGVCVGYRAGAVSVRFSRPTCAGILAGRRWGRPRGPPVTRAPGPARDGPAGRFGSRARRGSALRRCFDVDGGHVRPHRGHPLRICRIIRGWHPPVAFDLLCQPGLQRHFIDLSPINSENLLTPGELASYRPRPFMSPGTRPPRALPMSKIR